MRNGQTAMTIPPGDDPRIVDTEVQLSPLAPGEFCYVRARTSRDDFAWASPFFGQ